MTKMHHNRLKNEKSPYLLQHAANPVDWYPWTEEAFQKAIKEDKPIFLSIGYSTCHWCHVMEKESFENDEVAAKINKYFVPIKVDREERPDIDGVYMTAVTAMTGQGGWPLTVFLMPDKKPFFGGTYFPPVAKWGSPGLMEIMESVHHAWANNRDQLLKSGDSLLGLLKERLHKQPGEEDLTENILESAYRQLHMMFDSSFGGFSHSPKFPMGHNLSFLLRYWLHTDEPEALQMALKTLSMMANGGIYDQIGGGFHRYATDQEWQIPHFEKMLYDQAMLAPVYLDAYQITNDHHWAKVAKEIFDYVCRDLHSPDGGFYSAEDADSYDPQEYKESVDKESIEKKEGSFYLWREDELRALLTDEDFVLAKELYNIRKDGNAHSDPHGEFIDKNILYIQNSMAALSQKLQQPEENILQKINNIKSKLYEFRRQRPRPYLDDKILVDWNGLMIAALAQGARVLDEPRYAEEAKKATDFILKRLINQEGRLLRRYRDGESAILATLEDYAFFIHGLIELYQTNFDPHYLKTAIKLTEQMKDLFWDEEQGGFFISGKDAEKLIFNQKDIYDGAIPSGNSMAAYDLVRLYHLTFDEQWNRLFQRSVKIFGNDLKQQPAAYAQFLMAFDFALGPSQEIVIAGNPADQQIQEAIRCLNNAFLPFKVMLLNNPEDQAFSDVAGLALFVQEQKMTAGGMAIYICENHVCRKPINSIEELKKTIQGFKRGILL